MNPAAIRAALGGLVTSTTGIPADSVYWAHRPRGWTGERYAVCYLTAVAAQGRDAVTYAYDATAPRGAELTPTARGLRTATWTVQVTSHDATDAADALLAITSLRDRLHLDEVRDALAAVGVGVGQVLALRDLETRQDGRELSVAQVEVLLNATSEATGTALGYVETWGIKGEAELPDGTAVEIVDGVYP